MLVFVDESGHPHPNDSTKNPVLLGVCIHERDVKNISNQIYKIKDTHYNRQDEIKSTSLIREQTITKNRTINKSFIDDFISTVCSFNITVFSIIMSLPNEPLIMDGDCLPKQYHHLLKKVEFFCENHHYDKAIFVFDETNERDDQKLVQAFTGFLFKSRLGKTFDRILEIPLFVSSRLTPTIQIPDIFAGIVRHYYEHNLDKKEPENEFEAWIVKLYNTIYTRTEDNTWPGDPRKKEYGFFNMGHKF